LANKLNLSKARVVQEKLVTCLSELDNFVYPPRTVCGLDVSYVKNIAIGAAVLLEFPSLEVLNQTVVYCKVNVPYIPTFLSFREYPPLSLAYSALSTTPDVCFVDAHGKSHPRKIGAASHFGILRDIPTIGVAKRLLCGTILEKSTSWSPILLNDEVIGAEVSTKNQAKPIYVSIGHKISLDTAVELTKLCTTRFRLPEPTRQAHRLATKSRLALKETLSEDKQ
jgi:deoxyribonuclease V